MSRQPLVFTAGVFICGIILGNTIWSFPVDLIFLFTSLIILPFLPEKSKLYLLVIALMAAGSLRLHISRDIIPRNHINLFSTDSVLSVSGVIESSKISRDGRNQYVLDVDSMYLKNVMLDVTGKLIIFSRNHSMILSYGDRIRINGPVEKILPVRNPGQFDYQRYLAARGIYHRFQWNHPDSIRILSRKSGSWWQSFCIQPVARYARETFHRALSENSAALVQALLLGEKQDLEQEKIVKFQTVGVVHVLAISGLHVGFIVVFALTGLSLIRVPRQMRFWLLMMILFLYGAVVQFRPPVVRASLMAVFYLYAERIERKPDTDNLLSGAALIILIADPVELFNPGFQFSFIAVASILHGTAVFDRWIPLKTFVLNRFSRNIFSRLIINGIWMPLLVSLSAVLGTMPLTAYYYGLIPVVALLANLIVIPLIAGIVLLALFILILQPISHFIATGVADMIDMLHLLLDTVVNTFASIPLASVQIANPTIILVILLTLTFMVFLHTEQIRMRWIFIVLSSIILIFLILPGYESEKTLDVTFLDVGQGDAAHIRFPNGRTMLIDAGGADRSWDNGITTILPFLKKSGFMRLDYLVASHAHDDHIGGMVSLLREIKIDTVILNAYPYRSKRFISLQELCREKAIPVLSVGRGDRIPADPSCRVYILHPDSISILANNFSGSECNNSSIVLKIQYGDMGMMFTGDLEKSVEPKVGMYGDFLESEITKIAHHGSNTSTSDAFLKFIDPVMGVIPVAKKNKFRHPSPKTLERLRSRNIKIYRTSHTGAIMFRIYQDRIEKIAWRNKERFK